MVWAIKNRYLVRSQARSLKPRRQLLLYRRLPFPSFIVAGAFVHRAISRACRSRSGLSLGIFCAIQPRNAIAPPKAPIMAILLRYRRLSSALSGCELPEWITCCLRFRLIAGPRVYLVENSYSDSR